MVMLRQSVDGLFRDNVLVFFALKRISCRRTYKNASAESSFASWSAAGCRCKNKVQKCLYRVIAFWMFITDVRWDTRH